MTNKKNQEPAEIVFSYMNMRCHAKVVDTKPQEALDKRFIGKMNGYSIYSTNVLVDQFSFVAIKE